MRDKTNEEKIARFRETHDMIDDSMMPSREDTLKMLESPEIDEETKRLIRKYVVV